MVVGGEGKFLMDQELPEGKDRICFAFLLYSALVIVLGTYAC